MAVPPKLQVRGATIAAVILRLDAGGARVLLLRRMGGAVDGLWSNVTGRVEDGETAWEAAAREIREETGLVPGALYSADFCDQFYNVAENCVELVPMFVAIVNGDAPVTMNDENSAHRWVTIQQAIALVPFAGHRDLLRRVQDGFVDRRPAEWLRVVDYRP